MQADTRARLITTGLRGQTLRIKYRDHYDNKLKEVVGQVSEVLESTENSRLVLRVWDTVYQVNWRIHVIASNIYQMWGTNADHMTPRKPIEEVRLY